MTNGIFSLWLNSFNDKMKAEHRNVLLFLDNAPSHPALDLSNANLVYFPPNKMSVLQPMDQGVIQSLKLRYRKAQFAYMISEMEKDKVSTGTELMNKVNILNAVNWVASAWKDAKSSTIQKCFHKAGFKNNENDFNHIYKPTEPVPPAFDKLSLLWACFLKNN